MYTCILLLDIFWHSTKLGLYHNISTTSLQNTSETLCSHTAFNNIREGGNEACHNVYKNQYSINSLTWLLSVYVWSVCRTKHSNWNALSLRGPSGSHTPKALQNVCLLVSLIMRSAPMPSEACSVCRQYRGAIAIGVVRMSSSLLRSTWVSSLPWRYI